MDLTDDYLAELELETAGRQKPAPPRTPGPGGSNVQVPYSQEAADAAWQQTLANQQAAYDYQNEANALAIQEYENATAPLIPRAPQLPYSPATQAITTNPPLIPPGTPYSPASQEALTRSLGGPTVEPIYPTYGPGAQAAISPVTPWVPTPFGPRPQGDSGVRNALERIGEGALGVMDADRAYLGLPYLGAAVNAIQNPSALDIAALGAGPLGPLTAPIPRLLTDYGGSKRQGEAIRESAYETSPGLGVGLDILTSPSMYLAPGSLGKVATRFPALRPATALIEGVGGKGALPYATGAALGTEAAARFDVPFVPEPVERLAGGLLGGGGALGLRAALGGGGTLDGTLMKAVGDEAPPVPLPSGRSTARTITDIPSMATTAALGGTRRSTPLPAELLPNEPNLGVRNLPPQKENIVQQALNRIKRTPEDPQVRAIMIENRRVENDIVPAQANRVSSKAAALESEFKWRNVKGNRLAVMQDGSLEDIRDVAARLPEFEAAGKVTPKQADGIRALGRDIDQFRESNIALGAAIGVREDVMDGGVYLPRGRPEQEGLTGIVKLPAGFRSRGGKTGAMQGAVYGSVREGIEAGENYPRLAQSVQEYVTGMGRAQAARSAANQILALTDEAGQPLGRTARERIDPMLRKEYDDLGTEIARIRGRLATAEQRAGIATKQQDELDRALTEVQRGMPEGGTRPLARSKGLSQDLGERIGVQQGTAEQFGLVRPATERRFEQTSNAWVKLDESIPDDVDRIRFLETAVNRTGRRIEVLAQRGGQHATEAKYLRDMLEDAEAQLAVTGPRYQDALKRTPRDEGTIQLTALSGRTFPVEVANTANRFLNESGALQGRGAKVMNGLQSINRIMMPIRLGLDAGVAGIHGLIPLMVDKASYGKAAIASARAFFDGSVQGKVFNYVDDMHARLGLPTTQDMARNGLGITTSGAAQLGTDLGRVGEAIRRAPVFRNVDRQFGTFVDTWRVLAASNKLQTAKALGQDIFDDAVQRDIYKTLNQVTGYGSKPIFGEWGAFLTTAPRMYQGDFELLGNAVKGGGISGAIARDAVLRTVGQVALATYMANHLRGYDTEVGVEVTWEDGLPKVRFPSDWMAIKDVNGVDIKLLGRFDSLARLIVATANGDYTYAFETKINPGLGILMDLIQGENFLGEDYNLNSPEGIKNFAKSLLPLSAQNMLEGEGATDAITNFFGVKANEASYNTRVSRAYFEETGRDFFKDKKSEPRMVYDWMHANEKWQAEEQEYLNTMKERGVDWAEAVLDVQDSRKAFVAGQGARDTELLQTDMPPAEWRELRSSELDYLRGRTDEAWRDFDPSDSKDQDPRLKGYYAAMDQGRELTGKWDSAPLDAYMATLSEDDRNWIQDNTGLSREETPVEKAYRHDVRLIADSGYWDAADGIAKEFAAMKQYPVSIDTRSELLDYVRNGISEEMRKMGRDPSILSEREFRDQWVAKELEFYDEWVTNEREQRRMQMVDYDGEQVPLWVVLVKWGYKSSNKDERAELARVGSHAAYSYTR